MGRELDELIRSLKPDFIFPSPHLEEMTGPEMTAETEATSEPPTNDNAPSEQQQEKGS
jgi:hypothetical protein